MKTSPVVLAATDLSEPSDEAIRQADAYARFCQAELVVGFVVPEIVRANPLFPQRAALDAAAGVDLERRAAELVSERVEALTGRGPDGYRVEIDGGSADAGVLRLADEVSASLIVVGSRGASGIRRLLLGSVSARVLRFAACPVLVARPTATPGRVLVATDLSEPSLPALNAAAAHAAARGARLTVLHDVDRWPPEVPSVEMAASAAGVLPASIDPAVRDHAAARLRAALADRGIEGDVEVVEGSPAAAILERAASLPAELVVVGTHGRTGLARVALGSVAERVAEAAPCSVLAVRVV